MSISCERCVLEGTGLCDEMNTRPEESYRLWCVVLCDLDTSCMRRLWPTLGCCAINKHGNVNYFRVCNFIKLIEVCHFRLRV